MSKRRVLGNRRSEKTREAEKIFFIVVEGKSELNYFESFRKRNLPFRIVVENAKRQDPNSIVDICIQKLKNDKTFDPNIDKAAIVYDVDQNTSIQISECSKKCSENSIDMYLSSPSFECWLVMHFRDVNNNDTQDVLIQSMTNELKQEYKKSKNINLSISDDMVKRAIVRSLKKIPDFETRNDDCIAKYPSSTLHFLVQELLDLTN